jgi:Protein of unknown function (DUF1488)
MTLQRGEVLGYDFNRMVVDFTMFNQGNIVRCAISTAAMDDLEGKHGKRHLRLFRRGYAQFTDLPVHERVICRPPTATLYGLMIHDTVASTDEAMEKCHRHAGLSAQSLAAQGRGGFPSALLHSVWTLFRGFIVKGGCLDGAVGWQVAFVTAKGIWLRYRIAGELMAANRRNGATCA